VQLIAKMDSLASLVPPALAPLIATLASHAQLLGVAVISVVAIYLGYAFILSSKEAAVSFNVPLPAEVRANWTGKKWEDVQGEEKRVLEGQVRGVGLSPLRIDD
jgi:membrane protein implicated in regulation of membrane protease activity